MVLLSSLGGDTSFWLFFFVSLESSTALAAAAAQPRDPTLARRLGLPPPAAQGAADPYPNHDPNPTPDANPKPEP